MTALAFAIQAFQILPPLLAAGKDVVAFVNATNDALRKMQAESRDPTDAEWGALNAQIAALRKELHDE